MIKYIFLFFAVIIGSVACEKEEGEGGNSSISGKVFVRDLTSDGVLNSEYYASKYDVYIVYGDSPVFNDKTETHYDGTYLFDFLYPGSYQIYAYSDCGSCIEGIEPVIINASLSEDQDLVLQDLVVID